MTTTIVTLFPTTTGRRGQRYSVKLGDDYLVLGGLNPEHEAARVLLSRGITGKMTTVDERGRPRMHFDIETAAKLTVEETSKRGPKIRKWMPFPCVRVGPPERAEPSEAVR